MSKDREELIEVVARAAFYADMKLCEDAFGPDAETWEDNRRQPAYRTIAQAALSAIEGAGFVVLPREPTQEMKDAAYEADLDIYWYYASDGRPGGPNDAYRAMINAYSPKPSGVEDA